MGGAMAAVESGYLKSELVSSHAVRRARIEGGEEKIVGVNIYETTEPNPLTADLDTAIMTVDPENEARVVAALHEWRDNRDESRATESLTALKKAAAGTENMMEATVECARAGVTTGEWAWALRDVFGEFRAPTGVSSAPVAVAAEAGTPLAAVREKVARTAGDLGVGRLRLLVGKPGLDGHSNGAEQIAVRARDSRLRGGLPGHQADARADHRRRPGRGRALRGSVHPVRLARRAGAGRTAPVA